MVVYTGKHTKVLSMKQAEKFLHSVSKAVRSHSHTADSQKPHTPVLMDITPVQVQPLGTRRPANLAPASHQNITLEDSTLSILGVVSRICWI